MWTKTQLITNDYTGLEGILYNSVLQTRAKKVLELGSDVGDSTRIFAEALKETGGRLFTVDIIAPKWQQADMDQFENITVITANTLELDWNEPIDLLYIDDNHDYAHVIQELNKFGSFMREDGRILLHDVYHDKYGVGILRAVYEYGRDRGLPFKVWPYSRGLAEIYV